MKANRTKTESLVSRLNRVIIMRLMVNTVDKKYSRKLFHNLCRTVSSRIPIFYRIRGKIGSTQCSHNRSRVTNAWKRQQDATSGTGIWLTQVKRRKIKG